LVECIFRKRTEWFAHRSYNGRTIARLLMIRLDRRKLTIISGEFRLEQPDKGYLYTNTVSTTLIKLIGKHAQNNPEKRRQTQRGLGVFLHRSLYQLRKLGEDGDMLSSTARHKKPLYKEKRLQIPSEILIVYKSQTTKIVYMRPLPRTAPITTLPRMVRIETPSWCPNTLHLLAVIHLRHVRRNALFLKENV
jgi:hypothetical protein